MNVSSRGLMCSPPLPTGEGGGEGRLRKALLVLFIGTAIATSLAACGRRSDLHAPPGAQDSDYPRPYPSATP